MNLKTKISKLTKSELLELLVQLAETDENIETMLEYKLSTNTDEIKESKKLIRQYINRYKSKGFIMWRNVGPSLQGAEMVLEKGRGKLAAGEEEMAVRMGIAVLSIVVVMLQYADDSGGEVGNIINESLTLISDAASEAIETDEKRQQEKLFQHIMKESSHKRYDGWSEWRYDLLRIGAIFSIHTSMREKLEKRLGELLEGISDSTWSKTYEVKEIKLLQLEIFEVNQELEKAKQFIYSNLQYRPFREKAIEIALKDKSFEAAVELCKEGQAQDKQYPGLVSQWKKYELQAYKALGDTKKQRGLLLEFVYSNDFEAYNELKELYDPEEWKVKVEEIFKIFEEKGLKGIYAEIAKDEKRPDKLLHLCKKDIYQIQHLYPYLLNNYALEADELFKQFIRYQAEPAGDRKKYRSVCRVIKEYKAAFGDSKFLELKEELKEKYKRRPTFLDELDKV
ncbi:hypothetical protein CIL03_13105 [Virgibacillus indicus]|uniref:Uncharacterized protein n=1 Tax=Virgibacillus indicus TaxID=2024554 RepID=A0A265N9T1_9BACI|nr:hypothetical protein [Virgibacillus indicus]OZU88066.1 hypothetical protein CIL03_13105 [Virgibacillus indicus]